MLFIVITVAVVLIDQLTKALVTAYLQVGDTLPAINGILYITHVKNAGAAFGLLQNHQTLFYIANAVVIVSILYHYRSIKEAGILTVAAFALVSGGAIGNLIDRIVVGKVTDFVDIRVWPVFNVADTAIVAGAILLVILFLAPSRHDVFKDGRLHRATAGEGAQKENNLLENNRKRMKINATGSD